MKVPTMTIGETEQDNELKKLREENEALNFYKGLKSGRIKPLTFEMTLDLEV